MFFNVFLHAPLPLQILPLFRIIFSQYLPFHILSGSQQAFIPYLSYLVLLQRYFFWSLPFFFLFGWITYTPHRRYWKLHISLLSLASNSTSVLTCVTTTSKCSNLCISSLLFGKSLTPPVWFNLCFLFDDSSFFCYYDQKNDIILLTSAWFLIMKK